MVFKQVTANPRVLLGLIFITICIPLSLSLSSKWWSDDSGVGSLATATFKSSRSALRASREFAHNLFSSNALLPSRTRRTAEVGHLVRKGDTLAKIWSRFGGNFSSALLAERALQGLSDDAHKLRSGETVQLVLSPRGEIVGFSRDLGAGRTLLLDGSRTSGFTAYIHNAKIEESERTASGYITSSLVESALQQDIPYDVIDNFVDLFGDKIEFGRDLQVGDTYSVVYSEKRELDSGESVGAGTILAASITVSGKMYAAIAFEGSDGKLRYYDQNGDLLGNYFLRYPVKFTRISSVFSGARFHPVLKFKRPHQGVDFAAPTGTAVRTVADGVVEFAGYNGGNGNMIKIRHDNRWSTAYLHLSRIAPGIRKGARISRGDVIGAVGMTGLATGPHLHFSLYDRGKYVDPMRTQLPVLNPENQRIPAGILEARLELLRNEHSRTAEMYAELRLHSKA